MSASDQLSKLAARAKEAQDHAAAAQAKAKADLEQDVETARASAQTQAEKSLAEARLRQRGTGTKGSAENRSWAIAMPTGGDSRRRCFIRRGSADGHRPGWPVG